MPSTRRQHIQRLRILVATIAVIVFIAAWAAVAVLSPGVSTTSAAQSAAAPSQGDTSEAGSAEETDDGGVSAVQTGQS